MGGLVKQEGSINQAVFESSRPTTWRFCLSCKLLVMSTISCPKTPYPANCKLPSNLLKDGLQRSSRVCSLGDRPTDHHIIHALFNRLSGG